MHLLEILMRKISSRLSSFSKLAQIGGEDTVFKILNRIANGPRVSDRMLSALRGYITTDPAAVTSAAGRVSNLEGLIANSSTIPELAPLLPSVEAASGVGGALVSGGSTALSAGAGSTGTAATGAAGAAGSAAGTGGALVTGGGAAATEAGGALVGGGSAAATGTGGALVAGGGGAAGGVASAETAGTAAAAAGGASLIIPAALAALVAFPKINQMMFGGIDPDQLKTSDPVGSLRPYLIGQIRGFWDEIIDCDVAEWSYGGDLSDIADYENAAMIKNYADIILVSMTNPKMRDYASKQITLNSIAKDLAKASDVGGDSWASSLLVGSKSNRTEDLIKQSDCVKSGVSKLISWFTSAIDVIKAKDPAPASKPISAPAAGSPSAAGTGGGSKGQGTSDSGYESASLIMKSKGFLISVQRSWTPEFDAAFRAYVDAGTAAGKVPTGMTKGQEWSDVAGSLGFAPNKNGAFDAIKSLEGVVAKKGESTASPATPAAATTAPPAPISIPGEDYPVLAAIIGAMYNTKLVGTPGFDLVKEPKRIQALVDAVGGASPEGFGNAARVIAKMNPSIVARLPKEVTVPIDEVYAKNPANKALLQTIQVAINRIYDSAVSGSKALGIFNPRLEKSTQLVSAWLRSPAGGNWKDKTSSNNEQQWVKLATERKMRIRAEIAAEMTPAERAAARRAKMREAV